MYHFLGILDAPTATLLKRVSAFLGEWRTLFKGYFL